MEPLHGAAESPRTGCRIGNAGGPEGKLGAVCRMCSTQPAKGHPADASVPRKAKDSEESSLGSKSSQIDQCEVLPETPRYANSLQKEIPQIAF